jgi:elongation factor G
MERDDLNPETKPAGNKPPPRPPRRTATGLISDGDDDNKRHVTITKAAEGEGKFIRKSDDFVRHYGHVMVKIEPNGRGKGIMISSDAPVGTVPEEYIKPVTDVIREALDEGVYDGRPVVDIIVRIVGGSSDIVASDELAFKMAGIFSIKDALAKAEPIAIE